MATQHITLSAPDNDTREDWNEMADGLAAFFAAYNVDNVSVVVA